VMAKLRELEQYNPNPLVVEALKKNADYHREPTDEWKRWAAVSHRMNKQEEEAKKNNVKWERPIRPEPQKYREDDDYEHAHDLLAICRMQEIGLTTPEQQIDFLSKVGISPGVFSLEWVYKQVPGHTFTELPVIKEHESFDVETLLPAPPPSH